jgi:hypothetical protein
VEEELECGLGDVDWDDVVAVGAYPDAECAFDAQAGDRAFDGLPGSDVVDAFVEVHLGVGVGGELEGCLTEDP